MAFLAFVLVSSLAMASLDTTHAIEYKAANNATGTAGGDRFDQEIGIPYSVEILANASELTWQIFMQSERLRKKVPTVSMSVVARMVGISDNEYDKIFLNADYIAGFQGDVKTEMTGVMYYEVTRVWQWNGNWRAPAGLLTGIADFVRLKAGYAPALWAKPGDGGRWDEGYSVTARFLDYCNGLKWTFVAELNALLRDGYSENFFLVLLGKNVDQLWSDYKEAYSG